jgi:hypothetical protein
VTRIVDQHVDLAALGHDLLDRHLDRRLGLNVELDRAQVDAIALRGLAISAAFLALRPAMSRIEA